MKLNLKDDKSAIVAEIVRQLSNSLTEAEKAATEARDTATNTENIAENRHDTLGLEAAYLAHGQSQRVLDCQMALDAFKNLDIQRQSQQIIVGSLITVNIDQQIDKVFFLAAAAGGLSIIHQGKSITVITPSAPLGEALLGRSLDDFFELNITGKTSEYEITGIY